MVLSTLLVVSEAFDQLKLMGPSAIDVELRSLGPEGGGSEEMLHHMMQLLLSQLKTGKDFELVQAYMSLFLKVTTTHNMYTCVHVILYSMYLHV